jgi:hypothetical protein
VEVHGYRSLSVDLSGEGVGNVESTPQGIDCGDGAADCHGEYDLDTIVTLRATAGKWSTFNSWGGDCSGTASTCQVTMDAAKGVGAKFDLNPLVYLPLVVRNGP